MDPIQLFRHAYIVRPDEGRVRSVLARAREASPLLERDIAQFLDRLGSLP
jgi:hypothetical protein